MTSGGWLFLLISLAFVWSITIWCFYKVLSLPAAHGDPSNRRKPSR